jgi:hypothetical protein
MISVWTEEIEALRPCDQFFIRQTNIESKILCYKPAAYVQGLGCTI